MENKTVVAGLTKGFKLQTFRVQSRSGIEYEYVIENLNELSAPQEIEDLRQRKLAHDTKMASRNRDVSNNWKQDPPEHGYEHSSSISGEIVSCTGFEGNKFFVSYQVVVPNGWSFRSGNLTDGIAESELAALGRSISLKRQDGAKINGAEIIADDGNMS